jgi:hypothetical protein
MELPVIGISRLIHKPAFRGCQSNANWSPKRPEPEISDGQLIEIVRHVALNTWTNYINVVAGTVIDFPVVTARKAA